MTTDGTVWYLVDSGACHPHFNMALDEAFLLHMPPGFPVVLRFYDWDPPGLSLGYFQRFDEPPAPQADLFGAVVTRRTTGGGAILHRGEITFSIAGGEGRPPFDRSVEESYHVIHGAIACGLARIGIAAALREEVPSLSQGTKEHAAGRCFYAVTGYDLVAGGRKLVGSAQRRKDQRILHHGSIPLEPNPMTPEAACVYDLAGREHSRETVQAAIARGIEEAFAVELEAWEPGSELLAVARRIVDAKYGTDAWLRRR